MFWLVVVRIGRCVCGKWPRKVSLSSMVLHRRSVLTVWRLLTTNILCRDQPMGMLINCFSYWKFSHKLLVSSSFCAHVPSGLSTKWKSSASPLIRNPFLFSLPRRIWTYWLHSSSSMVSLRIQSLQRFRAFLLANVKETFCSIGRF